MNKKGFTLIELLAVIIILAIVALVATPIIIDVIDDARNSAALSNANLVYTGINNYCYQSRTKAQISEVEDICEDGVTVEEVATMVNLNDIVIKEVEYDYDSTKITKLKLESNGKELELQEDGTFTIDGKPSGKDPVTPPVEDTDYTDASGANKPELADGLTAIKYDGTNWIVADTTQEWYDYDNKEWANVVVLNSGVTKSVGDTVSESDIALWYVWVPRYKYQLFNAENGSVDPQVINITFETGTASTGTVTCTTVTSGNGTSSETCTNATNGNWYTHPAFTFGSEQLTGFWMGKFEISTTDSACNTNFSITNCNKVLPVTVKPNVVNWKYASPSNFFTSIQNIKTAYNLANYDSHMIKNMEWGAVAYLSHSKYGQGNTEIGLNNHSKYTTGCGASAGTYQSPSCYAYNTSNGMKASTTGNIYGVYDMSGGADEFVMGNMVNSSNEFYSNNAGFTTNLDNKYYDSYTYKGYDVYNNSDKTHGRGKLGDATKETLKTFGSNSGGWYSDYASFPNYASPWFTRGGYYSFGAYVGVFNFGNSGGDANAAVSSRAVLVGSRAS